MSEKKISLLVVDDDDINTFIIKKIAEKTGCDVTVLSKTNGQLAIDYLTDCLANGRSFPDLILVDINMPVLNGWEFIEAFEKMGAKADVDIFMSSSSVYDNDIEKSKNYKSIKEFISKPISVEKLRDLFNAVKAKQS